MKQYRITSEHYVPQGETGEVDAVMHADDLAQLKKLAGVVTEDGGGISGMAPIPQAGENGIESPVGSNISNTAETRNELMKEYGAMPGTDLWFIINFTKPYLNGSVRSHVEQYLKQHPEYRRKKAPGQV